MWFCVTMRYDDVKCFMILRFSFTFGHKFAMKRLLFWSTAINLLNSWSKHSPGNRIAKRSTLVYMRLPAGLLTINLNMHRLLRCLTDPIQRGKCIWKPFLYAHTFPPFLPFFHYLLGFHSYDCVNWGTVKSLCKFVH